MTWLFFVLAFVGLILGDATPTADPYEALEVPKTATQSEIRKAYKKLAMMYHPDKKSDEESAKRFAAINSAYDIIGNPDKRAIYDDFGKSNTKHTGFTSYWEFQRSNTKSSNDFYVGDPLVIRLNAELWNERVTGDNFWLVNFYAPWCTHCQQAISMYKGLAGKFDGLVEVASLNCHKDSAFCTNLGIGAYPTFILFYPKLGFQKQLQIQNGDLEPQLTHFINSNMEEWKRLATESDLVTLTPATFDSEIQNSQDFWVVIFTGGMNNAVTRNNNGRMAWMQLSANLRGLAKVALFDCDQEVSVCIREFPDRRLYYNQFPYFRAYSRGLPKESSELFSFDRVHLDVAVGIIESVTKMLLKNSVDACPNPPASK